MKIRSADVVFRELGEMYEFLRMLQQSRIDGETNDQFQNRQKHLTQSHLEHNLAAKNSNTHLTFTPTIG